LLSFEKPSAHRPGKQADGKVFLFEGPDVEKFNLPEELHQRIERSEYYRCLYVFKTVGKVVDIVYEKVVTVEPWMHRGNNKRGLYKIPSTAFCLLLKLFKLQLTEGQVTDLLEHPDSIFIRALGALYVRFGAPPGLLWKWLGPYCDDLELFMPGTNKAQRGEVAFGDWIASLLTDPETYQVPFPALDARSSTRIRQRLGQLRQISRRGRFNAGLLKSGFLKLFQGATGFLVVPPRALFCRTDAEYDDDDIGEAPELIWRCDAKILSVLQPYDGAPEGTLPQYQVSFAHDGSKATLKLGMIRRPEDPEDLADDGGDAAQPRGAAADGGKDRTAKRSRDHHRRKHSRRRRSSDDSESSASDSDGKRRHHRKHKSHRSHDRSRDQSHRSHQRSRDRPRDDRPRDDRSQEDRSREDRPRDERSYDERHRRSRSRDAHRR